MSVKIEAPKHKWICCCCCKCGKKEKESTQEERTKELVKELFSPSPPAPTISSRTMRWIKETPPQNFANREYPKYTLPDDIFGR